MTNEETKPTRSRSSPAKRRFVMVVVFLALLAGAYGGGRVQGMFQTQKVQEKVDAMKPQIDRMHRLEARRRLTHALGSLDQRNFGDAQQHLVAASRLLRRSEPPKKSKLESLATEIGDTSLVAADDFGDQRDLIESYIDRLDELVPETEVQAKPD